MSENPVVAAANEILKLSSKYEDNVFADAVYLAKSMARLGAESFSISESSISSVPQGSPAAG